MQNMIDFCIRKGNILSNEKLKLLVFLSVLLRREKEREREKSRRFLFIGIGYGFKFFST